MDELLDGMQISKNSKSYRLLASQVSQKIRSGVSAEDILSELELQGYRGSDIKNTVNKLYASTKKELNDLLGGLTKENLLTLKALLNDAIENDDTKTALDTIKELNKMIPKKIDKNGDNEQIVISFT